MRKKMYFNRSDAAPRRPWLTGLLCCHILLMAVALSACASAGSPQVPAGLDLSGQWRLNEEASDSVSALLATFRDRTDRRREPTDAEEANAPRSARGAPSRAVLPRDMRFGPPRTEEIASLIRLPQSFSLEQSPTMIVMKGEDGTRRYVYAEKLIVSVPDGLADQRAGWARGRFTVSLRAVDGRRLEHVFSLRPGGATLAVTTTLSGDGLPAIELERVYDKIIAP